MKLIFLGAPGAGKGTLADRVSKSYNLPTISTGNILRAAMTEGTELGLIAKKYIDEGNLVPDEVVIDLIKARLKEDDCQHGFILDGFPRTVPQAEALDKMGVSIDNVINLNIPDEKIIKRIVGRRVCPKCGASYQIDTLPPKDGVHCDNDGVEVIKRADDEPLVVQNRLELYHKQTEPLVNYYSEKGILENIDVSVCLEYSLEQFDKIARGR